MISPFLLQHESREALPQAITNETPADVTPLGHSALKDTVLIESLTIGMPAFRSSSNEHIQVSPEPQDESDKPEYTFTEDRPIADQYDDVYVWIPPKDLAPQYDDLYAPPLPEIELPYYAEFLRIAKCESAMKWDINTGNGFFGGLQFTQTSWEGAGGLQYAIRADLVTPYEQIVTAHRLKELQGFGAWPACAENLKLLS